MFLFVFSPFTINTHAELHVSVSTWCGWWNLSALQNPVIVCKDGEVICYWNKNKTKKQNHKYAQRKFSARKAANNEREKWWERGSRELLYEHLFLQRSDPTPPPWRAWCFCCCCCRMFWFMEECLSAANGRVRWRTMGWMVTVASAWPTVSTAHGCWTATDSGSQGFII